MNGQRILLGGLLVLILLNLGYLDYKALIKESETKPTSQTSSSDVVSLDQSTTPSQNVNYELIWSVIKEATASVTQKVDALSTTPIKTTTSTITTTSSSVKEYYIPLGTGSTSSTDWVAIAGAEAYVVPANFGGIREIYFEASLRVPTGSGRAFARLKNVTDNVSLFESEVSREGVESGLISSGKIPVQSTTRLYRVELKSSLGAEIKLDNARIKIFVP